jgi:hypothetical protein
MILELELKCFRRHEDLLVRFGRGLNVIRGPNEIGKTTLTEGMLYAAYGSKALRNTLSATVTWGRKEAELKARMVMQVAGVVYTFTRSKAGAEVNWAGGKVTGQAEVTKFASDLLGADEKTAALLMMASQDGLRGALKDGPTKVSELMGKLADFDLIDRILANAATELSLGSDTPVREKMAATEAELVTLRAAAPDETAVATCVADMAALAENLNAHEIRALEALQPAMDQAEERVRAAEAQNISRSRAAQNLERVSAELQATNGKLEQSQQAATSGPDPDQITVLQQQVIDAQGHKRLVDAYADFRRLPAYPEVAWDQDRASFDAEVARLRAAADAQRAEAAKAAAGILALKNQKITSGKCQTCGQDVNNDEHTLARNAEIDKQVSDLQQVGKVASASLKDLNDSLTVMLGVDQAAKPFLDAAQRLHAHVTVDSGVFPPRLAWAGEPPAAAVDVAALQAELRTLTERRQTALQAGGMVEVYRGNVAKLERDEAAAREVLDSLPAVDVVPLQQAYDDAYRAYTQHADATRQLRAQLADLQQRHSDLKAAIAGHAARVAALEQRMVEYRDDIETLSFNNTLVKKLKAMKPLITDHLWNNVLAAVSTFFSGMRGEQSVVTKGPDGFKVNGHDVESFSGSTLDILALAIRVALTKTFIPHASFMILDEPAHGCNQERTGNVLGFLSAVGFDQTILASHDELSEAVADNVVTLGA